MTTATLANLAIYWCIATVLTVTVSLVTSAIFLAVIATLILVGFGLTVALDRSREAEPESGFETIIRKRGQS